MIIDEQLKNILATGDEQTVNEVVATSLEKHKNYDMASQNPSEWGSWAMLNPRDSLRLMNIWVEQGKDVSVFADSFKPDLTPCETFANALGYARHLRLKYFLFRNYGAYEYDRHTYSTTKVRNKGNSPIGGTAVSKNSDYSRYESNFNNGPENNSTKAGTNGTEDTQITNTEKATTPRTVPPSDDKMSLRMINRSDPRFNGARLDRELAKLNEVKKLIRETMIKEMENI